MRRAGREVQGGCTSILLDLRYKVQQNDMLQQCEVLIAYAGNAQCRRKGLAFSCKPGPPGDTGKMPERSLRRKAADLHLSQP
jgi:hypothetical protein